MGEPFIGEIKMVGFPYAPRGWTDCRGQLLEINQNQALFALIGANFGGDWRTNFRLPDLQGRVPMHPGWGVIQGQTGGKEGVLLAEAHLPQHSHGFMGSTQTANVKLAGKNADAAFAKSEMPIYGNATNLVPLHSDAVTTADGSDTPHTNVQPSLTIRYIIAMDGLFPSRS